MKSQIVSLHTELDNYKPGLGTIMMDLQAHHSKLWFAGSNSNWKLADFQLEEIEEAIEDVEKFHSTRPEAKSISMLDNAMSQVESAIDGRNRIAFETSFNILTQTCNSCHQVNNVGFNEIRVPEKNPFANQKF